MIVILVMNGELTWVLFSWFLPRRYNLLSANPTSVRRRIRVRKEDEDVALLIVTHEIYYTTSLLDCDDGVVPDLLDDWVGGED